MSDKALTSAARGKFSLRAHSPALLAWAILAGGLICVSVGLYFQAQNDPAELMHQVLYSLAFLAFPVVGALILTYRPGNPIGWIFCAVTSAAFGFAAEQYAIYATGTRPGSLPGGVWAAWLGSWSGDPGYAITFTFTLLLFPNGRLPSARWRPLAWLTGGFITLDTLFAAFTPGPISERIPWVNNPAGIERLARVNSLFHAIGPLFFVLLLGCALSVLVRFGRAQGVERHQLKWFTYAAAMLVSLVLVTIVLPTLPALLDEMLFSAGIAALPVAVGIAILRYRLYNIDVIIRRTLVYSILTLTLGLVYLGCIVVSQTLIAPLTGGSELAIVASTLAIAALFSPLRRRIQTLIDRRFYRRKYDAAKVLAAFGATARDETDLERLTGEMLRVVDETMQPEFVGVWLRELGHEGNNG
jgi:hypothetical protein